MKKSCIIGLCLLSCFFAAVSPAQNAKKHRLGGLTKNLSNRYFLRMQKGYEYAAKKLGVDLVFGSVPTENAEGQQLNILEGWLNEGGFEGLVVTPMRATSLNSALATASKKGIPIVNIDELIPEDAAQSAGIKILTRIASNNVEAGKLDAEFLLKNLPKNTEVAVIEGAPSTTSSRDRVKGFTDVAKEGGFKVVASQPADWDKSKAYNVAANILQGNPNVKAFFCANDDMGLGAQRAIQAAGAGNDVAVVSVDGTDEAVDAVKQGSLKATVAQYPDAMAYLAVEALVNQLDGKEVAPRIDSPVKLISKENTADAGNFYKDE